MPKLFRAIFIIQYLCIAQAALAMNSALCPAPQPQPEDDSAAPHPSADIYHRSMQAAVAQARTTLDWVDDPQSGNACGGYYQAYANPNPQKNLNPEKADLYMSANMVEKDLEGYITLNGDVELYQGYRRLRCDTMRYSEAKQYSEVSGTILVREPGLLLLSDKAVFDNLNRSSSFTDTEYVLHEQQAHGKAGKIAAQASDDQSQLILEDASFTLCPPTAELWSFDARKIELDQQQGWGKMYGAKFEVAEVPLLYIPYIDFPIDDRRKTGLLWPTISSSDNGGIDLALPYYFNLAPQADLTYIPRYQSGHGTLHGMETRYKQKYAEWATGGTYLDHDNRVGGIRTETDTAIDDKRWMGFLKEEGRFNANWSTAIDYTAVSDINYFRDWSATGFDIKKSLNIRRFATLNFANEDWKASTTVIDYQSLELDPLTQQAYQEEYRRLPMVDFVYRNQQRNFRPNPVFFGQYIFFDHEQLTRAHRLHLEPGIMLPMRWQAAEMIPTFRIKHNQYSFNDSNDPAETVQPGTLFRGSHDISVPSFSMDNRLFLERELTIGQQSFVQTLTPRLYYYYAEYEDQSLLPNFDTIEMAFSYQQLFRDSRFGSFDRISDANQISTALESTLIHSNDGSKLLSIGLGQIHYFQDRQVGAYNTDTQRLALDPADSAAARKAKQLINEEIERRYYRNSSDIALEPTWHIDHQQQLSGNVIWDPHLGQNQETAIGYHYRDEQERIFNIAYRYKRTAYYNTGGNWSVLEDVDQTDLSLYWPVARDWHAYMRWNYDITNNTTIEDISGLKYEGCCFAVMFAYQRERKTFDNNIRIADTAPPNYSYNWLIQFELKGLGGITNTISSLLEESIRGFKKREDNL